MHAALFVLFAACSTPAPTASNVPAGTPPVGAPAPAAGSEGAEVVATVNGVGVTLAEVDAKAGSALTQARQQVYDARKGALDQVVLDKLVEAEAAKRGVTKEALLKAEVEDKIGAVQEAEIQALYESNKSRLGGAGIEEVRPRIEGFLKQQAQGQRMEAFAAELRASAGVKITLDPPRMTVSSPEGAPRFGPTDAPVQIIEWSDFECPYCGRGAETVNQIKAKYGDKVSVSFRHFPLEFHPNARKAAEASACAHDQGKFWEFHDKLFANQRALGVEELKRYAGEVSLDAAAFDACLTSGKHSAVVQADFEAGQAVGVTGTPGFFVNGRFLGGALPIDAFSEIIDEELARAGR